MNYPMSQTTTATEQQFAQTTKTSAGITRYISSALFIGAAILLLVSIAFPYWGLVLEAPQYPGGLEMRVFVNYMTGDEDPLLDEVHEIDGLNHYIGMQSLYNAAAIERAIALPAVFVMAGVLVAAAFVNRRWLKLLVLACATFPLIFLGDLAFWLNYYGQNLDPYAPLSSAIQPFTPPILGEGVIGQFRTVSYVNTGWYLAVGASIVIVVALAYSWRQSRSELERG